MKSRNTETVVSSAFQQNLVLHCGELKRSSTPLDTGDEHHNTGCTSARSPPRMVIHLSLGLHTIFLNFGAVTMCWINVRGFYNV